MQGKRYYRQGCMVFELIEKIPAGFKKSKDNFFSVTGESGHTHTITEIEVYYPVSPESKGDMSRIEVILVVPENRTVIHNAPHAHPDLKLPEGTYKVTTAREILPRQVTEKTGGPALQKTPID